jgi:hypothetical protein
MSRLGGYGIAILEDRQSSVASMIKKLVFDNEIKCGPSMFYTKDNPSSSRATRDSKSLVCTVKLDIVKINGSGGLEISFICSFLNLTINNFDRIKMLISNECIGGVWNMGFLAMTTERYPVPNTSSATDDRVKSCINLVLVTLSGIVKYSMILRCSKLIIYCFFDEIGVFTWMEINSSLPKGTVGVSAESLSESSRYFDKSVVGEIYFKLCRGLGNEGLYADAFTRIYNATKATKATKRWITSMEEKKDKDGHATIFKGCLKLKNLK